MTLCQSCSRTSFRRSSRLSDFAPPDGPVRQQGVTCSRRLNAGRVWPAFFLWLLSGLIPLGAQNLECVITRTGPSLVLSARLTGIDSAHILEAIHDGLESQISFQFRLYTPSGGIRSFFGDRLIAEREVLQIGSMDFFEGGYILNSDLPGRRDTGSRAG